MPEHLSSDRGPSTPLRIELSAHAGDALANENRSFKQAFEESIERGVTGLLRTLGIPGAAVAQTIVLADPELPGGRFLRIHVNDKLCRYSNDLLQSAQAFVTGRILDPDATPRNVLSWLEGCIRNDQPAAIEFLTLVCVETIKQRPAVLMSDAHAEAYLHSLPDVAGAGPLVDAARLLPVFTQLLDLRLSLADHSMVAWLVRSTAVEDMSAPDILEGLMEALRPGKVELQMPSQLLRQLTTEWEDAGPEMFRFLRDGLFVELGLTYPAFEFIVRDDLKPNCFTFKINHLTVPPFVSLGANECLVNEIAGHLSDLEAKPTANPVTRLPQSIVTMGARAALEAKGLTTWNRIGYFILCLAGALRNHSACFIDRRTAHASVDALEKVYPSLVDAVRARVSAEHLAPVLRGLAAEQISVRNLRLILEALLDFDEDSRSADKLGFVRSALRRQIATKYARGTSTMVVYLMDPKLEASVRHLDAQSSSARSHADVDRTADDITSAVRAEIDHLTSIAPSAAVPHILTEADIRLQLRDIVTSEFPHMAVLSYPEIPSSTNIQPIARIGSAS